MPPAFKRWCWSFRNFCCYINLCIAFKTPQNLARFFPFDPLAGEEPIKWELRSTGATCNDRKVQLSRSLIRLHNNMKQAADYLKLSPPFSLFVYLLCLVGFCIVELINQWLIVSVGPLVAEGV